MKQVRIFKEYLGLNKTVELVEKEANHWLEGRPTATILASHTTMAVDNESDVAFTLTLIVEIPES